MPFFYGYIRVSTKDQAERGMSLAVQTERIRAYYDMIYSETYEWGGIFSEPGISAETTFTSRRVGGVLSDRSRNGDVICVLRLDRAFRSLIDCAGTVEKWWDRGIYFASITEGFDFSTPHGKMIMQFMAALAEFERFMIGQRVKEAFAARRARGLRGCVAVPRLFEWIEDGTKLVPFEPERAVATKIVEWRDGGASFDAIAYHLMKHEIKKPAKGKFPERAKWTSADTVRLFYTELKLRYFLKHGWPLLATEFYYATASGDGRIVEGRSPLEDKEFWNFWHENGEPNLEGAYPGISKLEHPYQLVVPSPATPDVRSKRPVPNAESGTGLDQATIRRLLGNGDKRS